MPRVDGIQDPGVEEVSAKAESVLDPLDQPFFHRAHPLQL